MAPKTKAKSSVANRTRKVSSLASTNESVNPESEENVDPNGTEMEPNFEEVTQWSRKMRERWEDVNLETNTAGELIMWIDECKSLLSQMGQRNVTHDNPVLPPLRSALKKRPVPNSSRRLTAQKRMRHSVVRSPFTPLKKALASASKSRNTPEKAAPGTPQTSVGRPRRGAAIRAIKAMTTKATGGKSVRGKKATMDATQAVVEPTSSTILEPKPADPVPEILPTKRSVKRPKEKSARSDQSAEEVAVNAAPVVDIPCTPPPKRLRSGRVSGKPRSKESMFFQDRTRLSAVTTDDTIVRVDSSFGPVTSTPVTDPEFLKSFRQSRIEEQTEPEVPDGLNKASSTVPVPDADPKSVSEPISEGVSAMYTTALSHMSSQPSSSDITVVRAPSKPEAGIRPSPFPERALSRTEPPAERIEEKELAREQPVAPLLPAARSSGAAAALKGGVVEPVVTADRDVISADTTVLVEKEPEPSSEEPFSAPNDAVAELPISDSPAMTKKSVYIKSLDGTVKMAGVLNTSKNTYITCSCTITCSCPSTSSLVKDPVSSPRTETREVITVPSSDEKEMIEIESEWENEDENRPIISKGCPAAKVIRPKKTSHFRKKSLKSYQPVPPPSLAPRAKGVSEPERRQPSLARSPSRSPSRTRQAPEDLAAKNEEAERRRKEALRLKQEKAKREHEERARKAKEKREEEERQHELRKAAEQAKRAEITKKTSDNTEAKKKELAEKQQLMAKAAEARRLEKEEELKRQVRAKFGMSPEGPPPRRDQPVSSKSDTIQKAPTSALKSKSDEGVRTPVKNPGAASNLGSAMRLNFPSSATKKPAPAIRPVEKPKQQPTPQPDLKGALIAKKLAEQRSAMKLNPLPTLDDLRIKDAEGSRAAVFATKESRPEPLLSSTVMEKSKPVTAPMETTYQPVSEPSSVVTIVSSGAKAPAKVKAADEPEMANATFTKPLPSIAVDKYKSNIVTKPLIPSTPAPAAGRTDTGVTAAKPPSGVKIAPPFVPPSHVRPETFNSGAGLIPKYQSKTAEMTSKVEGSGSGQSSSSLLRTAAQTLLGTKATAAKPSQAEEDELQDYGLDIDADDDTDDEERPRKPIPPWAKPKRLIPAIREQLQREWKLDEIFLGVQPTEKIDLTVIFQRKSDHYHKRTSSQFWPDAPEPLGILKPVSSSSSIHGSRKEDDECF